MSRRFLKLSTPWNPPLAVGNDTLNVIYIFGKEYCVDVMCWSPDAIVAALLSATHFAVGLAIFIGPLIGFKGIEYELSRKVLAFSSAMRRHWYTVAAFSGAFLIAGIATIIELFLHTLRVREE